MKKNKLYEIMGVLTEAGRIDLAKVLSTNEDSEEYKNYFNEKLKKFGKTVSELTPEEWTEINDNWKSKEET